MPTKSDCQYCHGRGSFDASFYDGEASCSRCFGTGETPLTDREVDKLLLLYFDSICIDSADAIERASGLPSADCVRVYDAIRQFCSAQKF